MDGWMKRWISGCFYGLIDNNEMMAKWKDGWMN